MDITQATMRLLLGGCSWGQNLARWLVAVHTSMLACTKKVKAQKNLGHTLRAAQCCAAKCTGSKPKEGPSAASKLWSFVAGCKPALAHRIASLLLLEPGGCP
jgi:hypothetical protein